MTEWLYKIVTKPESNFWRLNSIVLWRLLYVCSITRFCDSQKEKQKKSIKYNWLYLFIVTQETLIFMGYYASGFCRLISHLLHGGAIHAWLLKTLTGISCMFIFFCCVANHYKCRSLRQTSVYYLTVSGMASLVSLLGSHGVESRSWPGGILTWSWHSFQSLFRLLAELGSLQLQTEVPIFLLTADLKSLIAPWACPQVQATWPSHNVSAYFFKARGGTPFGSHRGSHNVRSDCVLTEMSVPSLCLITWPNLGSDSPVIFSGPAHPSLRNGDYTRPVQNGEWARVNLSSRL